MKKFSVLFFLTILSSQTLFALSPYRVGVLDEQENGQLILKDNQGILQDKEFHLSRGNEYLEKSFLVDKSSRSNYYFKMLGIESENSFYSISMPIMTSGPHSLRGILKQTSNSQFYIDNHQVVLGKTKMVNGAIFTNASLSSFLGKSVLVQGNKSDRAFVINSIVDKNLYSAELPMRGGVHPALPVYNKDGFKAWFKTMGKNKYSQSPHSMKVNLWKKENYKVRTGERILMITLSGRQGDDVGAAGGHFAIGEGTVLEDSSINGILYNFYFWNEKEILGGHVDLETYFGHISRGQNLFRPTYTLMIYGISESTLLKADKYLQKETYKTRADPTLTITPFYNCTTVSVNALRATGFRGDHDNGATRFLDMQNVGYLNPLYYSSEKLFKHSWGKTAGVLSYALTTDPEEYIPRRAFEAYLKNLSSDSFRKKHGISRVDLIYDHQIPSSRPLGGMSYDEVSEAIKTVKEQDRLKEPKEIRTFLNSLD